MPKTLEQCWKSYSSKKSYRTRSFHHKRRRKGIKYEVRGHTCTCPDFRFRAEYGTAKFGYWCKHVEAKKRAQEEQVREILTGLTEDTFPDEACAPTIAQLLSGLTAEDFTVDDIE